MRRETQNPLISSQILSPFAEQSSLAKHFSNEGLWKSFQSLPASLILAYCIITCEYMQYTAGSTLVFPIRYIPIPEYRYSGLQIPIPIPAKMCRYLPVLRTYKMVTFLPNLLPFEKKLGNIPLIYFVITCKLNSLILAYLSIYTGFWTLVQWSPTKVQSIPYILLNAQIGSNLKLWML
jgi:hypothetical protein